jgi:hypothetical protein
MSLPITSCETERSFSKLRIIIIIMNKFPSTMVAERLNYLSLLFIENYIPKSLSDEEAIKQHAAIKCMKKLLQKCVR